MFNTISTRQKSTAWEIAYFFCCSFVIIAFPAVTLVAQDKIYKTDNTLILGKVTKIANNSIEYKKFSNLNGPVYTLSENEVNMILYENGEKETFNQSTEKQNVTHPNTNFAHFTGVVSIDNARMLVINKNINDAIAIYAQLVSKDSTNLSLNSEYSYALALGGIYDAALFHLDRLWNNGKMTPEVFYFISQVFTLMGDNDLAIEFCNEDAKSSAPGWISDKANELRELFGRKNPLSTIKNYQELITAFKHANKLASQNSNLQSIALFRDIINQYPNEYIPFIGYSIPLEKLGMLDKSVQSIEKAISLIQDNPDKKDVKQTLDNRITALRNKKTSSLTTKNLGLKSKQEEIMSPKMLIYAGAMLGSGYTSLNCRLGYFLSESMNGSIDLGLSGSSGTTTTNVGFSMYGRQKTFVYGAGLTCNLGSSTSIYAKISVGLSFLNKKHTASFDIFLNGNTPLTKGNPTTFTMSIGRSIYFGNRK